MDEMDSFEVAIASWSLQKGCVEFVDWCSSMNINCFEMVVTVQVGVDFDE